MAQIVKNPPVMRETVFNNKNIPPLCFLNYQRILRNNHSSASIKSLGNFLTSLHKQLGKFLLKNFFNFYFLAMKSCIRVEFNGERDSKIIKDKSYRNSLIAQYLGPT